MATRSWIVLPGGRIKRWNVSKAKESWGGVPPRWYRNTLNRKERRQTREAIRRGVGERFPYVHPREAGWYW
jgi:hypothetical protein